VENHVEMVIIFLTAPFPYGKQRFPTPPHKESLSEKERCEEARRTQDSLD
jgi:hypothetical protein